MRPAAFSGGKSVGLEEFEVNVGTRHRRRYTTEPVAGMRVVRVWHGASAIGDRKMPSLYDVAKLAGVSTATASRVLSNSRPVGANVRERVLESAAALDYSTNLHARALARSHDASVGMVVHDLKDPYFSEIGRGVLEGAEATKQTVLISNTYRDVEPQLAELGQLALEQRHWVDVPDWLAGAALAGSDDRDGHPDKMRAAAR